MGEKTAGAGHFNIPAAPAAGVAVAQAASANTYSTSFVAVGTTAAAVYVTGVLVAVPATTAVPTYINVQLATGSVSGATAVGQYVMPVGPVVAQASLTAYTVYRPIIPPIPVATTIQICAKTATSVASAIGHLVTLECINQANVVDDGVAVGTVTTVTNQLTAAAIATGVWTDSTAGDFTAGSSIGKTLYLADIVPGAAGGLMKCGTNAGTTTFGALTVTGAMTVNGVSNVSQTGDNFARIGLAGVGLSNLGDTRIGNLDAAVTTRMATYTQPTGFLAATFPGGTVANTTNITAGTITTATTATNLTNAPTVGDFTAAMKTSLGTVVGVAQTGDCFARIGVAGVGLSNLGDTRVDSIKTNTDSIKAKTDSLTFTVSSTADVNIQYVNDVLVNGVGTLGSPWGP